LAGLTIKGPDHPDGDIAIQYIGLRPGEKICEELVIGNNVESTAHPRVLCAKEACLPPEQVRFLIRMLKKLCARHDCEGVLQLFQRVADGYLPNGPLMDRLWGQQLESSRHADAIALEKIRLCRRTDILKSIRRKGAPRSAISTAPAYSLGAIDVDGITP